MLPALALLLAASPMTDVPSTVRTEASPPSAQASPAIPLDKVLHASISANLVLGVSALAHRFGLPDWAALSLGAGVALVLGVLREVLGNRDGLDMLANGVGVSVGLVTASLLVGDF